MSLWVDKHKPTSTSDLMGQNRNVSRIKSWLKSFDASVSKPIFLYGPPGIGKTTAAHLCCKECGYITREFNASDQRNKNIIKDAIGEAVTTARIDFFNRASNTKHAIILDEVDGMAGNEDRGGISQLIIELKNSKKPMIFICNDGQHLKLRSLKEKCEVIEFKKPDFEAIRLVVAKVAQKEGIPLSKINIKNLAESSDYDIRQIVNSLSLFKHGSGSDQSVKTTRMNAFEAARKSLSNSSSFEEKFECFFADYNIMPLFIFENYPKCSNNLKLISRAANMLCLGDLIDKEIRSNQSWSLLNTQALFSTVIPSKMIETSNHVTINFPQFLGKLSSTNKRIRLFQELNIHTALSGKLDSDCLDAMRERLGNDLKKKNIDSAVDFMYDYALLREDLDSIMELATWSSKPNPMINVDTKTKTAFTNTYKKRVGALPYEVNEITKPAKKRKGLAGDPGLGDDDADIEDDEEEETITIKPKKVTKKTVKESSSSVSSRDSSKKSSSSASSKSSSSTSKLTSQESMPISQASTESYTSSSTRGSPASSRSSTQPKITQKSSISSSSSNKDNIKLKTIPEKTSSSSEKEDSQSKRKSKITNGSCESNGTNGSCESNGISKPDKRPLDGGIARYFIVGKKPKS